MYISLSIHLKCQCTIYRASELFMADTHKKKFDTFVKEKLNTAQKKAATHGNGSVLVIAGAGSGKTRVITARITHLILQKNIEPSTIIALTFTNKAANEMKERITHFLGKNQILPFIGTFHAYCVRLLKQNSTLLNLPTFSIIDEDDKKKLLSSILQQNNMHKHITPRNAAYYISQLKNKLIDPNKSASIPAAHPLMQNVYRAYEQEKKLSNCFDFDDLLLEVLNYFKTKRAFKEYHQEIVRHILVDEYQDTNMVQHALLKNMAKKNKLVAIDSICAVGDEDQSIYSWRGATIANILNFKKDFAQTKTIKIEQNYRSVQPILDVANHVIQNNSNRNKKKLWSERVGKDRVRVLTCVSEYQEAEAITQYLHAARHKQKRNTIAILYRTHVQSRAIEEALIKHSIPYKIIGGIQFYERKEIKDIFAYLRLIVNPFDRSAFLRIINIPARGLGKKFEEEFHVVWNGQPFLTFIQVAQKLIVEKVVTKTKKTAVESFITIFDNLTITKSPSKAIEHIIEKTGYIQYLKDTYEPNDAQTRIENLQELNNAIKHFEAHGINAIEALLDEVALMRDHMNADNETADTVLLMTLHAAKGLEFDTVILAGLEEGTLPTMRSFDDENAIEEERRLFYVGITRAKERLLLTHTKHRYKYGKMVDQISSRFLDEIPHHLAVHEDGSYWKNTQQYTFFADWLGVKEKASTTFTFGTAQKNTAPEKIASKTFAQKRGSIWKKNQPIKHATYGVGLIQKVEKRGDHMYVTVKFKAGVKKIVSRFLQPV